MLHSISYKIYLIYLHQFVLHTFNKIINLKKANRETIILSSLFLNYLYFIRLNENLNNNTICLSFDYINTNNDFFFMFCFVDYWILIKINFLHLIYLYLFIYINIYNIVYTILHFGEKDNFIYIYINICTQNILN